MLVVTDHNKLLKDAMNKIGPITNMSEFIAEWVERSFGMAVMIPPTPDNTIQADVTIISSKNGAKSMNDTYQQMQDRLTATDIPLSTSNKKPKPD